MGGGRKGAHFRSFFHPSVVQRAPSAWVHEAIVNLLPQGRSLAADDRDVRLNGIDHLEEDVDESRVLRANDGLRPRKVQYRRDDCSSSTAAATGTSGGGGKRRKQRRRWSPVVAVVAAVVELVHHDGSEFLS